MHLPCDACARQGSGCSVHAQQRWLTRTKHISTGMMAGVMLHCAAVHAVEAVAFAVEWLGYGCKGSPALMAAIIANAVGSRYP